MNGNPAVVSAKYYFGIKPSPRIINLNIQDHIISFLHPDTLEPIIWEVSKIHLITYKVDHLILRYGNKDPFEYLELNQSEDIESIKSKFAASSLFSQKSNLKSNASLLGIFSIIAGFVLLLGCTYYYALPSLNQWAARRTPKEWEIKMGNTAIQQFLANEREDVKKSYIINQFFDSLEISSSYPIKLYVLNDSIINAFAMPGGHIVVCKGILDRMCSYQELVGLLGHEFAHIEKQHSLKTIYQSVSSYLMISLIFGDLTGIAAIFVEQANNIKNLSYSRSFELEADQEGLRLMLERNINPQGILDLFNILKSTHTDNQLQSSFFSTHPLTEERIQKIKGSLVQGDSYPHSPALEQLFYELQKD
ncbi:MAG: M48 family metallopeptidase [Saprospiraceae bacterium]|nr:M48 family metallopeptidase [Candidatus Defluviibacterium haderslevense]